MSKSEIKKPVKPLVYEELTSEQFSIELNKGIEDYLQGRITPAEEITDLLTRKLNQAN